VRIAAGTFSFNEEFPAYRYKHRLAHPFGHQTCNDVFDAYLAHCAARLAKFDLAYATLASYRRAIDSTWRPAIGSRRFDQVNYSMLVKIADAKRVGKKTYNNIVSVLRRAFEHGYRDHPERHNPARGLKTLRMHRKDRLPVDPFAIEEAETLIAVIHQDWGEVQGNYDEFRFFTGLRPSEQIALLVSDCDLVKGTIAITKARVMARDKDRTKTSEDRTVALCPRALEVLKRQLALRERWQRLGVRIDHEHVFFKDDGEPIRHLHYGWKRWRHSLERLDLRPRAPYKARHSFITWNLMIGKNALWVAKQHGHSAHLMLDVYANWIEGADASQIATIEQAMQRSPAIRHQHGTSAERARQVIQRSGNRLAEREGFEPSLGF
jgi:integrase